MLAAALLAVLAGCAQPGGDQAPAASTGATSAPGSGGASPTAGGTGVPPSLEPPTGTGKPTPPAGETTLTGTVQDGVESGCLILSSGGRTYLLLGGDRTVLVPGASVTVRGVPTPGVATTCMQGIPFQVSSANRR
jgi:hypothetical protein